MGAKSGQNRKQAGAKRLALVVFGALFILLFVVFAIAEGLGEPSVPKGDVALVQSVPSDIGHISEAKFKRTLLQVAARQSLKKAPKVGSKKYEELKTETMGELLSGVWVRGAAEEHGIEITEKQIETELANIKKQNFPTTKAFNEFLKTQHYTADEVNEQVELQLLSTKLREEVSAEAHPASSSEIQDYYNAEKATQFSEPETRDVRVIVNEKKAEVDKAKEALEADSSPASWKKVAKKYSSDPTTSSKGGLQKAIPEQLLQGQLKKAIYGSATDELVGPIKYQGNYLLIEVVKLNPAKVKTLAEVRSQISQTLSQQIQQEFFSEFVSQWQSTWTSRSFCASGYEVEQCANYPSSKRVEKEREAYKACYEAHPKAPATECPAPVTQTKPAVPGTVSVVKRTGEQLVQRPLPEAVEAAGGAEALEGVEGATGAEGAEAAPEAAPEGESGE